MHNQRITVPKLSKLQKRVLEEGLRARWDEPIHRAWRRCEPGSFDIRLILVDFLHADKGRRIEILLVEKEGQSAGGAGKAKSCHQPCDFPAE